MSLLGEAKYQQVLLLPALRLEGLTKSNRATHLQAVNFFSFDMYRKTFTRVGGGVLSNEARLTAGALAGGNLSPAFLQLCPAMQTLTHALSHEHGLTATAWHPHLLDADAAWHISSRGGSPAVPCSAARAMLHSWQRAGTIASLLIEPGACRRRHSQHHLLPPGCFADACSVFPRQ